MEFPIEAICLHSTIQQHLPNQPIPTFTQYTITRMIGQHAFISHISGEPDKEVILHITDTVFIKPETVAGLFRRALYRKGVVSQEYYAKDYCRLVAFQLEKAEEGLEFCMTSDDALEQAVKWESLFAELGLTALQGKNRSSAYMRYAVVLEKVEAVIDQNYIDEKRV